MKGELTIEYLVSFIVFIGIIGYIYLSYSANIPSFIEEVRKEDIRSKAFQLSEILVNDPGNPVNWTEPSPVPVDVVLVIDISGSMDGEGSPWEKNCRINCTLFGAGTCTNPACTDCNRCSDCDGDGHRADPGESPCAINDAKDAASTFVYLLNDTEPVNYDQSGIVAFNETAYSYQGLTVDQDVVNSSIYTLYANQGANTSIGYGIRNATVHLMKYGRNIPGIVWAQILLTDGVDYPVDTDPEGAADNASDEGIVIYTIGLGNNINVTLLNNIASKTDGEYYHAPSPTDLEDIYREIAFELKIHVDRIGLSDENFNKQNLISNDKIEKLIDITGNPCTDDGYNKLKTRLLTDKNFTIIISNITDDGIRKHLYVCTPPFPMIERINVTIVRVVALYDRGILQPAEMIIQM